MSVVSNLKMEKSKGFSKDFVSTIQKMLYTARNSKDTMDLYDEWADNYDNDENALGYKLPLLTVEFLEEVLAENNKSSVKILDLAAGTGFVGGILRCKGFDGIIDGHDGSEAMLQIAKTKGIYNRTFFHIIEPDTSMPKELSCGYYDVVVICGALNRCNMLRPECIQQFVNCVREGGLIIFSLTTANRQFELDFNIEVQRVSFQLECSGAWSLFDMKYLNTFRDNIAEDKDETAIGAYLYCYTRLK